jgi:predicted nuclease with TOPRIM domain
LLAREKEELQQKLSAAEQLLSQAQQRLATVGQPHSYLLEQLERAQDRHVAAEREVQALQEKLEQLVVSSKGSEV